MEKTQSHYDRIAGVFFFGVGAFFALYATTIEIGAWNEPGPGFLPFWGGITLVTMSAALLARTWKRKGIALPPFFPERDSWKRVAATFAALIAYNLVFDALGFTVTTFLFIGVLVKFIFPQSWLRSFVVAAAAALIARLLFVNFLQTQLPQGFLGI
ncbi:MAG: tripartite tricarboxylate transporter TctB family protein [Hyphomicrobiales bacterium]